MATRLEKLFWSLLCGTALGLAGCESEPGEDAWSDVYGVPVDFSIEDVPDTADVPDDAGDMPVTDPLYGPPG